MLSYCPNNKQCLPSINVTSSPSGASAPGTTITWNIPSGTDHQYLLTCTGVGAYNQYISNSGSMFFSHNQNDYKLTYSISCSSSSSCSNCKESKTFVKKGNNNGNIGTKTDCQKTYLSYKAESLPNMSSTIKIICESPSNQQSNEYDYLKVHTYKIYKTPSGQTPTLVQSGSVTPGVSTINLPSDPGQYFEIRLYSNNCEYNLEHYIYKSYQGNGGLGQLIDAFSFQLFKSHVGGF